MKLADYAKSIGLRTACEPMPLKIPHPTHQLDTGTVIVDYDPKRTTTKINKVAIYTRVSSSENKENLDRQAERLTQYSIAKGYQIAYIVKEIGSGLNDTEITREAFYSVMIMKS